MYGTSAPAIKYRYSQNDPIPYFDSNGTDNYTDTTFDPADITSTNEFEIEFKHQSSPADFVRIFGVYDGTDLLGSYIETDGDVRVYYASGTSVVTFTAASIGSYADSWLKLKIENDGAGNLDMSLYGRDSDGTYTQISTTQTQAYNNLYSTYNICLFCLNNQGTEGSYADAQISYLRIAGESFYFEEYGTDQILGSDGTVLDIEGTVTSTQWLTDSNILVETQYEYSYIPDTFYVLTRGKEDKNINRNSIVTTYNKQIEIGKHITHSLLIYNVTEAFCNYMKTLQAEQIIFYEHYDVNKAHYAQVLNVEPISPDSSNYNYRLLIEIESTYAIEYDETDLKLLLTYPTATSIKLEVNIIYNITWETNNLSGNVNIELWKGGLKNSDIATNETNDGSYSWTVPLTQTLGTDYKIKIVSVNDESVYDFSDNNFEIYQPIP